MEIVKFEEAHVTRAIQIAHDNYNEQREHIDILPDVACLPDLQEFAKNGLGVAAFEGDRMIGFLCCFRPWAHAFDSNAIGTFSPIHAHGAIKADREKIYRRMYEVAAKTWVVHKIAYHAVALYAHDQEAIYAFYTNGFGMRCMDAIRKVSCIETTLCSGITFEELPCYEASSVRQLRKDLSDHLGESPCFMMTSEEAFNRWVIEREKRDSRLFAAKDKEQIVAFIEVADEGENFVTETIGMKSICGAFCLPAYRGKNIVQSLLNFIMCQLQKENNMLLGVDFESFNPTAYAFWRKYFKVYTNSLVRRIDEGALDE